MSVSSTSNSKSTSSSSIDVAAIVSQLMTAENRPLDALNAKIERQKVVISDLGTVKSKIAVLQGALDSFQSPSSYNGKTATITNAGLATVTASASAVTGNYVVSVQSVAQAAHRVINQLPSTTELVIQDGGSISLTVGNGAPIELSGPKTATELVDAINDLDLDVQASLVQASTTEWSIWIDGKLLGASNNVTVDFTESGTAYTISGNDSADSVISYNGTSFTSSSKSMSGVISGVTFDLIDSAPDTNQVVKVSAGADNSEASITALITAYNDLMSTYKSMTSNALNSSNKASGSFGNNPTMLSFIGEIKSRFALGGVYQDGDISKTISLSSIGIDLQLDGTMKINTQSYVTAKANGLLDILGKGVNIGAGADSTNTLSSYLVNLNGYAGGGGSLMSQITVEAERYRDLGVRQFALQDKLNKVQNNLITQYSALNALLFQLSSTSNSLMSALDALNNNNNN
jgi:flagellar hook-associated protein 2